MPQRRRRQPLPIGWLAADVVALWVSFVLAFFLRFGGRFPAANFHAFLRTAPWLTLGWLLLAHVYSLYERRQPWAEVAQGLFLTAALGGVLAMAISFVDRGFAFPRSVLLIAAVLDFAFEVGVRRLIWLRERRTARRERALLICAPQEQQALSALLDRAGDALGVELLGVLPLGGGVDLETLAGGLAEWLGREGLESLVLSAGLSAVEKERAALMAVRAGVVLHVLPSVYEVLVSHAHIEQLGDALAFRLVAGDPPRDYEIAKRVMDLSVSAVLLLVVSPLLAAIAAVVAVVDGRPVLYVQERMGRDGRVFRMVKFRTMVNDAEKLTGPVLASTNDPRLTRTGRLLRHWRLDELPQLWNVVRGDMSLVGPRPERPELHAATVEGNPEFQYRLQIAAGLTGLAQVSGGYDISPEEKLKHDLLYATRSSLLFDLNILIRTFKAVWQRKAG